jgi:hypothetical protein
MTLSRKVTIKLAPPAQDPAPVTQNKPLSQVTLYAASIEPQPVPAGGTFAIKTDYAIYDASAAGQEIDFNFSYQILKGDKVLLQKDLALKAREGQKRVASREGLRAARIPGNYQLRVSITYKDKTSATSVPLVVQ